MASSVGQKHTVSCHPSRKFEQVVQSAISLSEAMSRIHCIEESNLHSVVMQECILRRRTSCASQVDVLVDELLNYIKNKHLITFVKIGNRCILVFSMNFV